MMSSNLAAILWYALNGTEAVDANASGTELQKYESNYLVGFYYYLYEPVAASANHQRITSTPDNSFKARQIKTL